MSEANGKDPTNGRFLAGNRHGGKSPGNPAARRMGELRRSVLDATTEEQVREAMDKLRALGIAGDVQALRAWIEFTIGKPTQAVEVSLPDGPALDIATVAAVVVEAIGDDRGARLRVAASLAALARSNARGASDGVGD